MIDDLISKSDYELFIKMCLPGHSSYHLLPPIVLVNCVNEDILFCSLNILYRSPQKSFIVRSLYQFV